LLKEGGQFLFEQLGEVLKRKQDKIDPISAVEIRVVKGYLCAIALK